YCRPPRAAVPPFPTRRSSDLATPGPCGGPSCAVMAVRGRNAAVRAFARGAVMAGAHLSASRSAGRVATQHAGCGLAVMTGATARSEEHTSELQSRENLVCRLL